MADDRQRIDDLVNRGLTDQWEAVAKSGQVKPGKPTAFKALGRNLVLWRDVAGSLKCLEDYCPHRGARLSRGEGLGDNIACRYHGVSLAGTGNIVPGPARGISRSGLDLDPVRVALVLQLSLRARQSRRPHARLLPAQQLLHAGV